MRKIVIVSLLVVASIAMALSLLTDKPAVDFLESLTPAQRNKTQMPFNDESRILWHYIPSSMFPRAGIQSHSYRVERF